MHGRPAPRNHNLPIILKLIGLVIFGAGVGWGWLVVGWKRWGLSWIYTMKSIFTAYCSKLQISSVIQSESRFLREPANPDNMNIKNIKCDIQSQLDSG